MESHKVSKKLLNRLSLYLRYLKTLPATCSTISASAIAQALALGEVQVRKDLAKVSDGGRCRIGHQRDRLIADMEGFLSSVSPTSAILIGAGNWGQLLAEHDGSEMCGLDILARFDMQFTTRRTKLGKPVYPISKLDSFCCRYDVRIGIVAVPPDSVQAACDRLIHCGIETIWDYASASRITPDSLALTHENSAAANDDPQLF